MASAPSLPLTRKIDVERLPQNGDTIRIDASAEERAALAADFDLPGVQELIGLFEVTGGPKRVHVKGQVRAQVTQVCGVTLEPFEASVLEDVDVVLAPATPAKSPEEEERRKIDPPDEIVDGRIDLGALTAEFLALGLDPYPRKPGVVFEPPESAEADSPFAALRGLGDSGGERS